MKHTIHIADIFAADAPKSIVCDDEAGTVSGDHSAVPKIAAHFENQPVTFSGAPGVLVLNDPAHRPEDFVQLLRRAAGMSWDVSDLPEPLRSVTPTSWDIPELPDGWIA